MVWGVIANGFARLLIERIVKLDFIIIFKKIKFVVQRAVVQRDWVLVGEQREVLHWAGVEGEFFDLILEEDRHNKVADGYFVVEDFVIGGPSVSCVNKSQEEPSVVLVYVAHIELSHFEDIEGIDTDLNHRLVE